MDWTKYDAIEVATVGRDRNAPVIDGQENVERLDGLDATQLEEYVFVSHSVYLHLVAGGVECIADCWTREMAQQIGHALAQRLKVPCDDYTLEMGPSE